MREDIEKLLASKVKLDAYTSAHLRESSARIQKVLEAKLYDLKFRFRGALRPSPELAIVTIDDDSVKKIGRWPWSREIMIQLLSRLQEAGHRVITLDTIFAEREETQALKTIKELRREIAGKRLDYPDLIGLLAAKEQQADVDQPAIRLLVPGGRRLQRRGEAG